MTCLHTEITIHYRIIPATYYEPGEYEEWAECDWCGMTGDPNDFDAETIRIERETKMIGVPHEHYD